MSIDHAPSLEAAENEGFSLLSPAMQQAESTTSPDAAPDESRLVTPTEAFIRNFLAIHQYMKAVLDKTSAKPEVTTTLLREAAFHAAHFTDVEISLAKGTYK